MAESKMLTIGAEICRFIRLNEQEQRVHAGTRSSSTPEPSKIRTAWFRAMGASGLNDDSGSKSPQYRPPVLIPEDDSVPKSTP